MSVFAFKNVGFFWGLLALTAGVSMGCKTLATILSRSKKWSIPPQKKRIIRNAEIFSDITLCIMVVTALFVIVMEYLNR